MMENVETKEHIKPSIREKSTSKKQTSLSRSALAGLCKDQNSLHIVLKLCNYVNFFLKNLSHLTSKILGQDPPLITLK